MQAELLEYRERRFQYYKPTALANRMSQLNSPNRDQFSFKSVEVFVAILEERSITKAAKRLGCSASTVSNQLVKLETVLGGTLIRRSAQRFELTAAGELFAGRARNLLDEVMSAKAEFSSQGHAPTMHLRIAVIEDFDLDVLPLWLKLVRKDYPSCTFDVQSGTSHESHASLYSRGVDMIVAADNTALIEGVDEHQILSDPYVLVLSKAAKSAETIDELIHHPFVRYSSQQLLAQQIEAQLRRSRITPIKSFECSSTQAVMSLVEAFDGWAFTTAAAALGGLHQDTNSAPNLIFRNSPLPNFSRTVSLYCRRGTLGEMPEKIANHLRSALQTVLIPKARDELPFMSERVSILHNSNN